MAKLPDTIIKPIEEVDKFIPEENFFYRKAYLSKSNKTEEFYYYQSKANKPVYLSKKAPSLVLTNVKTDQTVGTFESYWPMRYGITKERTLKLGAAFAAVKCANNDWATAFKAADMFYETYLELRKNELFCAQAKDYDNICFDFRAKENKDCYCHLDFKKDKVDIFWNMISKKAPDEYDDNHIERYGHIKFVTMKKAFDSIIKTFEQAGYDPSKANISIESSNSAYNNNLLPLSSWISKPYSRIVTPPTGAVKAYKALYERLFPEVKFPSAYLFSVENSFGTKSTGIYIAKTKAEAYKEFVEKNEIDITVNETSYCKNIWKLCSESEGAKQW